MLMHKLRSAEKGFVTPLLISFILALVLFLSSAAAALWAYQSRQDYKNNSDQKVQQAVSEAIAKAKTEKDNEYAEKDKSPLREYSGPSAYGSVVVKYPKSWSAFVNENQAENVALDGYFHPGFVPGGSKSFALRLQIVNAQYDAYLQQFTSNIKAGKTKATAFRPTKVSSELGTRLDGELSTQKKGSLVAIKLRDKTLVLWTEADQYVKDFDTYILPNFTFSP